MYRTTCRKCKADIVFVRPGRATIRDQFGRVSRVVATVTVDGDDDGAATDRSTLPGLQREVGQPEP